MVKILKIEPIDVEVTQPMVDYGLNENQPVGGTIQRWKVIMLGTGQASGVNKVLLNTLGLAKDYNPVLVVTTAQLQRMRDNFGAKTTAELVNLELPSLGVKMERCPEDAPEYEQFITEMETNKSAGWYFSNDDGTTLLRMSVVAIEDAKFVPYGERTPATNKTAAAQTAPVAKPEAVPETTNYAKLTLKELRELVTNELGEDVTGLKKPELVEMLQEQLG